MIKSPVTGTRHRPGLTFSAALLRPSARQSSSLAAKRWRCGSAASTRWSVSPALEGALLSEAHLKGAFLGGAHLERADLSGATGDAKTQLPDGEERPAGWPPYDDSGE